MPTDREALDECISVLAQLSGDVTIDEFRERAMQNSLRAEGNVRRILFFFGFSFMAGLLLLFALDEIAAQKPFRWAVSWALALGGLGAVTHILLHVLKLGPQQPIYQKVEELEAGGRIFLGCIFAIVLSLSLFAHSLTEFAKDVGGVAEQTAATGKGAAGRKLGLELLFPFLCGYSIPLVLGLLDKFIQAIEMTLSLNDPRLRRRPRTRRP